jgi:hypothetical protein
MIQDGHVVKGPGRGWQTLFFIAGSLAASASHAAGQIDKHSHAIWIAAECP